MTENTDKEQIEGKNWLFKKGQSGNPSGRPKGSKNKASLLAKELIEAETESIIKKLIEIAKEGDLQAIKLVIERLLPPIKEQPFYTSSELPKINNLNDVNASYAYLVQMLDNGEISLNEAKEITALFDSKRKSIEATELKEQIDELKAIITKNR